LGRHVLLPASFDVWVGGDATATLHAQFTITAG